MIRMVVGLGNPGKKYEGTRHNVGRQIVESLRDAPLPVIPFVTSVFMNESGREISEEARRNGVQPEEILVVLDEFQIPLRKIKILSGGSDGGHNGMTSIIQWLKTEKVPRLRIGIGPLPEGRDPADFVLERFTPQEAQVLEKVAPKVEEAVATAVNEGLVAAMNKYNNVSLT
jgi:PTH1 family peptidyl-tRNA hydrolase